MFLWLVANLKQGVIYFIKQACGNDILASVYRVTVAVWPENPFSPLLTRPQGPQGCQMKRNHSLNMPLEVWCAKIDPKLNKLEKIIKIEKNSSKMSVF